MNARQEVRAAADQRPAVELYGGWVAEKSRDWPARARHNAVRAMIDVIAVMIPGARDEATETVRPVVAPWGDGPSHVVGDSRRMAAPWAALVNGVAAHALDFDDNFDPAKAHATAVLAPALLAVADAENLTGADLIDGYIVGLEIMCRVGQGLNPYHRARGWHATSTVGAIGAAAACARLLRLDARAATNAISMATSVAGGFMSQFGTMTKPLHAGLAAQGGVMAAYLARGGVTAGRLTLDGPHGMATLMVGPDRAALQQSLIGKAEHGQDMTFKAPAEGEELAIILHGLKVKRFPNCGSVHRSLDGLLELREKHGLTPANVAEILVRAPAAHLANLMYHDPQTPMEARFSMEYGLATALVTGSVTLNDFLPDALFRQDVRREMAKVKLDPVDKLESEFPTEVIVTLTSGERVATSVAMPIGSKANPMSDEQLVQKLRECAAGIMDDARIARVEQALLALDGPRPVRDLTALLAA
ncbi:MAG TPA: MmgE/PrpD family protein [Sphingomonadales bacterium]